jgi:hypothetical protein
MLQAAFDGSVGAFVAGDGAGKKQGRFLKYAD